MLSYMYDISVVLIHRQSITQLLNSRIPIPRTVTFANRCCRLSMKTTSVLKVLVPWVSTSIAVGLDSEKTVTVPLELNGFYSLPTHGRNVTNNVKKHKMY